jgi:serine/threonine protein kinase
MSSVIHRSAQNTVRKVKHESGELRATKQFEMRRVNRQKVKEEVAFLEVLAGKNHIIKMFETFTDGSSFWYIMELCDGGSLASELTELAALNEREASTVLQQTLMAVKYMHDKRIAHRAIKAEYILIKAKGLLHDCDLKVIGFTNAAMYRSGEQFTDTDVGTMYYNAPEISTGRYTHRCDIWSCGVIL